MDSYIVRKKNYPGELPSYLILLRDDDDEPIRRIVNVPAHQQSRLIGFVGYGCTWLSKRSEATRFARRYRNAVLAFACANVSRSERNDPERPIQFVRFKPGVK